MFNFQLQEGKNAKDFTVEDERGTGILSCDVPDGPGSLCAGGYGDGLFVKAYQELKSSLFLPKSWAFALPC